MGRDREKRKTPRSAKSNPLRSFGLKRIRAI